MSFPAVERAKGGVTSVNKYWTTGTMLGKIHPGRVNTGMRKFEEGHDRTMEHGISQEEKGSSPAQLCTSRLLQRLSMQNSHVVRNNVSPSLARNG